MISREQRAVELDDAALAAIQSYTEDHGYPPSRRDLCELLGLASPATVQRRIESLERRGLIRTQRGIPRSIIISTIGKASTEEF